ncbi:hypothetical protein D3C72_1047430 [compost metagenome]
MHTGQFGQFLRLIELAAAAGQFVHLLQRHHIDIHRLDRFGDCGHVADLASGDIETGYADLRCLLQAIGFVFQTAKRTGHFTAIGVAVGMATIGG